MSAPPATAPLVNGCHDVNGTHADSNVTTDSSTSEPQPAAKNAAIVSQSATDLSLHKKETNGSHTPHNEHPAPAVNSNSKVGAVMNTNETPAVDSIKDLKGPESKMTSPSNHTPTSLENKNTDVSPEKETTSANNKTTKKNKPVAKTEKKSQIDTKRKKSREEDAIKTAVSSVAEDVPKERRVRKRKESETLSESEPRTGKRVRLQHLPFQHPAAQQMQSQFYRNSFSSHRFSKDSNPDDRIVVFNRGEFLAVRNDSDSFYICRTTQNVFKTSRKFKIQWLQNEKNKDIYQLDFLDQTDFECVLTNLRLNRLSKGEYELPPDEKQRVLNILHRAINVERGVTDIPDPKQVAADGIDVSVVGKKEEKELLVEVEASLKKEAPVPAKSKSNKVSEPPAKKKAGRKPSTESTRSSTRKSDSESRKEDSKRLEKKKSDEKKQKKEDRKELTRKVKEKSKKPLRKHESVAAPEPSKREKRSTSCTNSKVLVKKIVDEIKKKHRIETASSRDTEDDVKTHKKTDEKTSRPNRNSEKAVPAPAQAAPMKPPQHHETIRGLVNLLNTYSSNCVRSSALKLLQELAADYPKVYLPFIVETLLTGHNAFMESEDNFAPGPYFPRRSGKEAPIKSRISKSCFQMYFNQKMLSVKIGTDKEYDRAVADYYSEYYAFIVAICKIGIESDFVSGDLVSLCSTVALESLPIGSPVFVSFWKELVDAEESGQESQFLEVLSHCPNFRNYIIAILNQERKFLLSDDIFELAKSLAPKVKAMSTLTQKLVSNRTLTLIDDVSKDYSSFDQVKDIPVFLMVLRALNLSLLFECKPVESEKLKSLLKDLRNDAEKKKCNGAAVTNGNSLSNSSIIAVDEDKEYNQVKQTLDSILKLLENSK